MILVEHVSCWNRKKVRVQTLNCRVASRWLCFVSKVLSFRAAVIRKAFWGPEVYKGCTLWIGQEYCAFEVCMCSVLWPLGQSFVQLYDIIALWRRTLKDADSELRQCLLLFVGQKQAVKFYFTHWPKTDDNWQKAQCELTHFSSNLACGGKFFKSLSFLLNSTTTIILHSVARMQNNAAVRVL